MRTILLVLLLLSAGCGASRPPAERFCAVDFQIKNYLPGQSGHVLSGYTNPRYRIGQQVREQGPYGVFTFIIQPHDAQRDDIIWSFEPERTVSADERALYQRRIETTPGTMIDVDTGRIRARIQPIAAGR